MILYFVGMILLKLLLIAAIALGIYKLVVFIHRRYEKSIRRNESNAIEILKNDSQWAKSKRKSIGQGFGSFAHRGGRARPGRAGLG